MPDEDLSVHEFLAVLKGYGIRPNARGLDGHSRSGSSGADMINRLHCAKEFTVETTRNRWLIYGL